MYHWLSSLNHYIYNMLRAIEYRLCPTEEPKVLLAGTSGCCRFAYKRALHMKITACKERKLPLCPRHCRVGLAKGAITIPKAMYKAGKSGHKPSATGKQGGLMDAVSWEVGNCAEQSLPRWISSLPEKCIHPGRNKYRAVDCIHAWQEKTRTCETKKHWCYPYMETFYLNKID